MRLGKISALAVLVAATAAIGVTLGVQTARANPHLVWQQVVVTDQSPLLYRMADENRDGTVYLASLPTPSGNTPLWLADAVPQEESEFALVVANCPPTWKADRNGDGWVYSKVVITQNGNFAPIAIDN